MNDSQGVFFRYEPMWHGISLITLTSLFLSNKIPPRCIWAFTLTKNIVIFGILLLGNLLMIQVIRSENKIIYFYSESESKETKKIN